MTSSLFKVAICVAFFVALSAVHSQARTKWYQLDQSYTFDKYIQEFGKTYDGIEYAMRSAIFHNKLQEIIQHNSNPEYTWKKGVNKFTDRTDMEFSKLLGYNKKLSYKMQEKRQQKAVGYEKKTFTELESGIDWRLAGVITDVKDQGDCGSCWSFGTSEVIESYWALKTGQLGALSEQQILDCTPNTNDCGGTGGCGGGTPELAYNQIIDDQQGLASEWTYAYQSYQGSNFECSFDNQTTPPIAMLSGYTVLPSNMYEPVMEALTTTGPLAVNVDAGAWSDYEMGVFSGCNQQNPDINHVVQLVGYGTDPKLGAYWLVRNSWSPVWGEAGYIRLTRSSSVSCGVDMAPQDGTGCNGGPSNVTVCGECAILYDVSYPIVM